MLIKSFLRNESGATAIEYGLIAAGIAVAIMATVTALGSTLSGKFKEINTSMGTIKASKGTAAAIN